MTRAWCLLGLVALGCIVETENEDHCANMDDPQAVCGEGRTCVPWSSACKYDAYAYPDGCVDNAVAPEGEACCAEGSCPGEADEASSSSGAASGDETGLSDNDQGSTGLIPDLGSSAECDEAADCPRGSPACVEGSCVACDLAEQPDEVCASRGAGAGECVEGRCRRCDPVDNAGCRDPSAPTCDASFNCRPCREHEECPGSACLRSQGICIGAEQTLDVTPQTLEDTLTMVGEEPTLLALGEGEYPSTLVLTGSTVILQGPEPEAVRLRCETDDAPALTVRSGAEVYLSRLRIEGCSVPAVDVDGAEVIGDRVVFSGHTGGAVQLQTGTLELRNAAIIDSGVAIDAASSSVRLINVTLAANVTTLSCDETSGATMRNSIALGRAAPSLACAGLEVRDSLIDTMLVGEGVEVDSLEETWFADLEAGDVSLSSRGAERVEALGVWRDGDPLRDLAGQPRVGIDGTAEAAGARLP